MATNADLRYPTLGGLMPGAGAIVAALQATTGQRPLVIGKPEPAIFQAILKADGVAPRMHWSSATTQTLTCRPRGGRGFPVILVLTGVTDAAAAAALDGTRA